MKSEKSLDPREGLVFIKESGRTEIYVFIPSATDKRYYNFLYRENFHSNWKMKQDIEKKKLDIFVKKEGLMAWPEASRELKAEAHTARMAISCM